MTQVDPRTLAFRQLAAFASGIIPTQVLAHDYEPTRQDAKELIQDLDLLAAKVDAVIAAYGDYLQQHGIIRDADTKEFNHVLRNALEGNAFFCIERGIEERIEERAA